MMKTITLILFLFLSFTLSIQAGVVKISGSLKQFGMDRVDMNNDGIAAEVYNDKTTEIVLDSNGRFDLKLKLKRPAYYKVGHNILYLTPGDDLEIVFNRTTTKTTFKGKGEKANTYLKKCGQLNGWDIAKEGQKLDEFGRPEKKLSFEEYRSKVDCWVESRLQELTDLTEETVEFHELEAIRVRASQLIVYLDYFMVGGLSEWNDTPELKLEKRQAFYRTQSALVEPILKKLTAHDYYLELPEVRSVLQECYSTGVFSFQQSPAFLELVEVLENTGHLDEGLMLKDYQKYKVFSRQIRNKDLRSSFNAKLQQRARLMEGRPAVDIPFKDIDGKEMHLSDFKGKMLYVDFWATWCMPCLFQLPEFEKLSEQYPDIQFIGISIDQKVDWWKKKLQKDGIPPHVKEFLADPYVVGDAWDISSIPRFLLIDEDFNIINAFAPRPSEKGKIQPLLTR